MTFEKMENISKKQRDLTKLLQDELDVWKKLISKFNSLDRDELLYDLYVCEKEGEEYLEEIDNLIKKTGKISSSLSSPLELEDNLLLSILSLKQINNHLRRILRKREILREKGAKVIQETYNSIIHR